MAFVLPGDYPNTDLSASQEAWKSYTAYLQAQANRFPPSAYAFATAPWHYDASDPRCPHDSWVESLIITELAQGERQQLRSLDITIRLLGAYHDGTIQLSYSNVFAYTLYKLPGGTSCSTQGAHDDWLVDELRLNNEGHLLHEIIFASQARWLIECHDMAYQWFPFESLV